MKRKMILLYSLSIFCLLNVGNNTVDAATVDTANTKAEFEIESSGETLKVEATPLAFGSHTITPLDIEAKATTDASVTVTEFSGTQPGWNLTVSMSEFKDESDPSNVITAKNIKLFYPTVTPRTTTGGDAASNPPSILGPNTSFIDSLSGVMLDDTGASVTLATAAAGKGYGDWKLSYNSADKTQVQIKIPTGQRVGNYSSTLTYSAVEGP